MTDYQICSVSQQIWKTTDITLGFDILGSLVATSIMNITVHFVPKLLSVPVPVRLLGFLSYPQNWNMAIKYTEL